MMLNSRFAFETYMQLLYVLAFLILMKQIKYKIILKIRQRHFLCTPFPARYVSRVFSFQQAEFAFVSFYIQRILFAVSLRKFFSDKVFSNFNCYCSWTDTHYSL